MDVLPAESNTPDWSRLGSDLTDSILSLLPLRSILRAGAVCKLWRSIVTNPSSACVSASRHHPWLFLLTHNSASPSDIRAMGFDPYADEWVPLPTELFLPCTDVVHGDNSVYTSGDFFFLITSTSSIMSYVPVLSSSWLQRPPVRFTHSPVSLFKRFPFSFFAPGGVRLWSMGDDEMWAVEVYDKEAGGWKFCPPLPEEFRQESSARWLTSTLVGARLFVFGIYSGFIASFDLQAGDWSEVHTLRPPGVRSSFLLTCDDGLLLAGLRKNELSGPSLGLWRVEEGSLEFGEKAVMPQELLRSLFDGGGDDDDGDKMFEEMYGSLRCVGMGKLIYVFKEGPRQACPACVCEISGGEEKARCRWRRIPELPEPVGQYDELMGFSSMVHLST